ncbi:MAG TPA: carboxypeptidase regulatory-like domain-containing protein [Thermodesulfobacteriota bacterium]|nr:carboxypeptidase regulatory-like domain-containing protein [Deltaproteobacteria bacterium]HNR14784.1 carboxypeptidase regulatory-like domain-containing protein [Thermodesulfobacteriota bacterium]HNU71946.1 carboxypeptidase regulatory-like domain-containing protein [Thermodesulfobacteriota bacterium]HOC38249.1 carboxypeptidase regulatory-like domain-containing protein [Thermodesulfobacteriota bacterium]HQO78562.1 carboxypeptidase regulatory-like domain-containing protein [Thermodesulfobacteri
MKRALLIFCMMLASALWGDNAHAQKVQPVDRLNHSGDIQGIVECPLGTPIEGAWVSIPGHSFMARTDARGSFRLYNVPEGIYDILIEATSGSPATLSGVAVHAKNVENIGTFLACSISCEGNSECPEGYYCAKSEGDCDGPGVCTRKPTVWIEIYAPVCGCDGRTYVNEGEAAGSGVNVAYEGPCLP